MGRPVALPDEQAGAGRRRRVLSSGPRVLGKGRRPGFVGVAEDDGDLILEPFGVLGEVTGEGPVEMSGFDCRGHAPLRAVEPGREAEGLLGGGAWKEKLRARGAPLEFGDDRRGSSGGRAHP